MAEQSVGDQLLDRLQRWSLALDSQHELEKMRAEGARKTPESFEGFALADWPLVAAVALVDAVALRCEGSDEGRAQQLCEQLFGMQGARGLFELDEADDRPRPTMAAWASACAAILYVSRDKGVSGLFETAGMWWRQVIDEQAPLTPFMARPEVAALLAIGAFILYGRKLGTGGAGGKKAAEREQQLLAGPEHLGTRLFYRMENVPLPKPINPWPSARRAGKES